MNTLGAVLAASLVGSLHCAGMCGGFVMLYAGPRGGIGRHVAYNLGRLLSYTALGVSVGFVAGRVDVAAATWAGVGRVASVVLGALLVLIALREFGLLRRRAPLVQIEGRPGRRARLQAAVGRLTRRPGLLPALAVGLLSALLPCGWLWSFVVVAGSTADPLRGGLVMAAFWLGTVPVLVTVGGLAQALGSRLRRYARPLAATTLLLAGLYALAGKWTPMTTASADAPPGQPHCGPGLPGDPLE